MNLDEMTNAQGYYYRNRLLSIMKSKGYDGLGIMYNAVESMPELDQRLATGTESIGPISMEEIEELCKHYSELRKAFNERYSMFYERCVRDDVVRGPLRESFSNSKPLVKSFMTSKEEDYVNVYNQTEGLSADEALEAFRQIVRTENGLDLKKLIDECTEKAYS